MNLIHTLYALPTVLIGLLVFLMLSRKGPFGFLGLLFTPPGAMIIGQVILIIPILVGLIYSALTSLDPIVKDTIISLGADRLQFVASILREVRFVIYAAIAMAFGRAISEVGGRQSSSAGTLRDLPVFSRPPYPLRPRWEILSSPWRWASFCSLSR